MPRELTLVGYGTPPVRNDAGPIRFEDRTYGPQQEVLAQECGDFLVRRSDGVFAYQLAVVVDDAAEPLLVAECKAPGIPVGRQTLAQAVRYNSVLKARYVVLTNGLKHYCCELRDGEYVQLGAFPRFGAR